MLFSALHREVMRRTSGETKGKGDAPMMCDDCEYRDARLAFWTEGWYDDGEDEVVEANVQISQDRPPPPGAKLSRLLVPSLPAPASRGQKCTNIFSWSHACPVAAARCRGLMVEDSDGGKYCWCGRASAGPSPERTTCYIGAYYVTRSSSAVTARDWDSEQPHRPSVSSSSSTAHALVQPSLAAGR